MKNNPLAITTYSVAISTLVDHGCVFGFGIGPEEIKLDPRVVYVASLFGIKDPETVAQDCWEYCLSSQQYEESKQFQREQAS